MPRPIPLKHNNASPILLKHNNASPDSSQTQHCLSRFFPNTTMPRPILVKHNAASPDVPQISKPISTIGIEPITHQPTSQFHETESFWRS
jgi:hypothetical protein